MEDRKRQWEKLNRDCLAKVSSGNYSEAIEVGARAEQLAQELFGDPSPELAESQKNLAMAKFYGKVRAEVAKAASEKSLKTAEKIIDKDPRMASEVIYQHAVMLHNFEDYANAEIHYNQALDISKSHGIGKNIIAKYLSSLAQLYYATDRVKQGDETAVEVKNLLGDYLKTLIDKGSDAYREATYDYATNANNIGYTYERNEDYKKASENYTDAANALIGYVELGGQLEGDLLAKVYGNISAMSEHWPSGTDNPADLLKKLNTL